MSMEASAKKLLSRLEQTLFEHWEINKFTAFLHPDIIWMGPGGTIEHGQQNAAKMLHRYKEQYDSTFTVLESQYQALPSSENQCLIAGCITLQEMAEELFRSQFSLQISALCCMSDQGILLRQIHISKPEPLSQEWGLPSPLDKKTRHRLKELLEEQSAQIEEKNRDLRTLTENVPGGIFRCRFDEKLTLQQMSEGFLSMFGYTRDDIEKQLHNSFWEMILPQDRHKALEDANRQLALGDNKELEYRVLCRNGTSIWVLDKGQRIREPDGTQSFYCILVDITRAKKAQEELNLLLERHRIILDQSNDIIFEWDIGKDTLEFSTNWEKKFGYQPITRHVRKLLASHAHVYPPDRIHLEEMMLAIIKGKSYVEAEIRLLQEEIYLWCRIRATAQYDKQGRPIKAVGVIIDIDNEKRESQRLLEQAERDTLTKLYNKGTAQSMIETCLRHQEETANSALLVIDVDNFKMVNDTKGHLFGDAFLVEVSSAICRLFRGADIVGRIGGDEFIVFVQDMPEPFIALQRAEQIVDSFRGLTANMKNAGMVSCSVGVALFPAHGRTFQELYKKADHALYRAKKQGKNQYVLYDALNTQDAFGGFTQDYTAINETIDSNDTGGNFNSKMVEYVFRILYKCMDIEKAIDPILEIIGRQFDVSRAYIFENTEDGRFCLNTFEWCNDGILPQRENLQHVSYELDLGGNYFLNFDENDIFYCRDISKLPAEQFEVLEPQGIKSMLQCAIRDGGQIKGYVGFDDCRINRFWTQEQVDILVFISEVLGTFLLKKRAQDQAMQVAEGMRAVLDNQSSCIFVLDIENYEILYLNRKVKEYFPSVREGVHCYEAFFGRCELCENCKLANKKDGQADEKRKINIPVLNIWTEADVTEIAWNGKGAILLTCHEILQAAADPDGQKEGQKEI